MNWINFYHQSEICSPSSQRSLVCCIEFLLPLCRRALLCLGWWLCWLLRLFTQLLTKQLDLKNAHESLWVSPEFRDNDETTWIVFSCSAQRFRVREGSERKFVSYVFFFNIIFLFCAHILATISRCCYHCSTAQLSSFNERKTAATKNGGKKIVSARTTLLMCIVSTKIFAVVKLSVFFPLWIFLCLECLSLTHSTSPLTLV